MNKVLFYLLLLGTLHSCARVGSPNGGSKDSIPPQLVGSNIDTTRVNVPRTIKQLRLNFNEYVTLKEVQKNLIISPPIKYKRILPTTLGNKYILVEWDEDLLENTTYNFNWGNAIADLNEGNILPYFNFAFSTGATLEETYISGDVSSGFTRVKKGSTDKNEFVVGLYQEKDTMDYTKKPYYITKADPDGYFELNYLTPGKYRLIAFNDTDQNSVFTPGKDEVYFQKETLNLEKSISGMKIQTLPSQMKVKYIEAKEQNGGVLFKFEGNPERVEVLSKTEKLKEYTVDHQKFSDSVMVWFDDKQLQLPENNINENLRFSYVADTVKGNISLYYKANVKDEFTLRNSTQGLLPPSGELVLESTKPITQIQPEKWTLKVDSLAQQPFTAEIFATNKHKIRVKSAWEAGKKYQLIIPKETVVTFYERLPKSHQINFEFDKPENYGSLVVKLVTKPDAPFWAQLLSENDEVKYSQLVQSNEFRFSNLKPGTYYVRLLVDSNGNGHWDSGNLLEARQAEPVYIYDKLIEIRPLWDNIEDKWDPLNQNAQTLSNEAATPKN